MRASSFSTDSLALKNILIALAVLLGLYILYEIYQAVTAAVQAGNDAVQGAKNWFGSIGKAIGDSFDALFGTPSSDNSVVLGVENWFSSIGTAIGDFLAPFGSPSDKGDTSSSDNSASPSGTISTPQPGEINLEEYPS